MEPSLALMSPGLNLIPVPDSFSRLGNNRAHGKVRERCFTSSSGILLLNGGGPMDAQTVVALCTLLMFIVVLIDRSK